MSETTTACVACDGTGKIAGFGCPGFRPMQLDCWVCGGKGQMQTPKPEWAIAGQAMKWDRQARDLSLREEALKRKMSPIILMKMEKGLIEPVTE